MREALWQELQRATATYRKPWILAGDFNETTCLAERNHGGPEMLRRCTRFRHWIENTGLIDLGFARPKFTWTRGSNRETRKEARLECLIEHSAIWNGEYDFKGGQSDTLSRLARTILLCLLLWMVLHQQSLPTGRFGFTLLGCIIINLRTL